MHSTMLYIFKITYVAQLGVKGHNATPHKEISVRDLLRRWRWEILEHTPNSPDLSPCDYDLIPKFKAPLRRHRFRTRDDTAIEVRRLIMTNFGHGEADGIRRLLHC